MFAPWQPPMLSPTVVFNTTNTAGNAQINNVHHNYNIVHQATPDQVFKLIQNSINRVEDSRQQLGFLAWTIAELLRVLDEGLVPGLSGFTSTSSTINNLQELLEEIHNFIEAEGHESFIKLLLTKERRIAQIDAYQKKVAALANAFQISALLDIAKWQAKNDAAKVEDQHMLYARLDELERDRELLRKTLDTHQEGLTAMMIAFQTRLEQQLDGDRERQFFSKSVTYLQTATGRSVKLQDWMVTSFDVQFVRPIASGGFGEVLLGRWQQMEVALKVLKTEKGVRASSKILETEVNVWSRLRHPHILPFLGANVWSDRPFIVMPYLKNGNARDYIQNYPECNRTAILHQASLGLVHLHNMNIVHADLKGHNILIDDSGKAVLCDFGLSRVKADINSQSVTSNEEIYGSTNWMAPERLLGRPLRKPSDIYSFGMTIYEIFTNEIPLADVLRVAFTQLVARDSVRPEKPSTDDGAPHLTDEIWAIAERCWAHEPSDRPLAKDICNSLEDMAKPYISDSTSTPPSFGTPSQILGTMAAPEAGPSSGRKGAAREEQDQPAAPADHAEILPLNSVHVTFEDLVPEGPRGKADGMLVSDGRKEDEVSDGSSYAKATPYGSSSGRSTLVEVHNYRLSYKDRIVIVMGPPGSGKTTFIDFATTLQSQTSALRIVRTEHPRDQGSVVFIDTPGFDGANWSDSEVLSCIAGWFVKAYKGKVSISAILYLHRISDNMVGSPLKNLQMFASICGQEAMPRVIIGTTMWSETTTITGGLREGELKRTFWADMIKQGCAVKRFDDSYESAWKLIGKLPMQPASVLLSREMHDGRKNLSDTAAGVMLIERLQRLINDRRNDRGEEALRLEEHDNRQDNPVLVAELQQRQVDIEQNIGGVTEQVQMSKIPLGRKISRFFTGHKTRKSDAYEPPGGGQQ